MSYTNGLDKPTDYFNTKLYTGNGNSSHAITGVGFQPDWVWIKDRDSAVNHLLHDSIRGVTNLLVSNTNAGDDVNTNILKSFDTDGFTVGSNGASNENGTSFVSWNWLGANGTASNTDGSITSTVSANTTSGFSIVSYTGTGSASDSVGHGLSQTPGTIFVKRRDSSGEWRVWHQNLSATTGKNLRLNTTDAEDSNISFFYSQPPNSTTFRPGSGGNTNASSGTYIAYCFAEKKGFSKFGSYTGNGNNDGTFVYTGFKPAFVLVKRTDGVSNWGLIDNTRDPFNVTYHFLEPNVSDDEFIPSGPQAAFDFCSQGFKCRSTNGAINASGGTYIFMAFASEPFTTSTGIPCTAR